MRLRADLDGGMPPQDAIDQALLIAGLVDQGIDFNYDDFPAVRDLLAGAGVLDQLEDLPPPVPIIVKDKAFYKQFSLRELAYIYNSGEISHSYAHSVIQSGTKIPTDYAGRIWKFEDYQRRGTKFTSAQIFSVVSDYQGYTMNTFADLVNNKAFGNDKARYIMSKLGIYDLQTWQNLTGFVPKGQKFLPTVGKNIGNLFGGVASIFGNFVSKITGGVFEGLFGAEWKSKIIIAIIIIIIILIVVVVGIYYAKAYVGAKAVKKVVGVIK